MEFGGEQTDGLSHTMSRSSRLFNGAGFPPQDGFAMEDELPPRSLTPPGDFASDPDEVRRKVAKRLQPLHDLGPNEGQAGRLPPRISMLFSRLSYCRCTLQTGF